MYKKLVFFSNFLNHHQVFLADEFYRMLGDDYAFVATMPVDEKLLKGGSDFSTTRPYCVRAYERGDTYNKAMGYARSAEVCVFGADAMPFELERAKAICENSTLATGTCNSKLTFEICERWLKKGWLNLASPRLLKWFVNYHLLFKPAGFYRLCASAFCKVDDEKFGAYKNRSFKWGYFTQVDDSVVSKSFNPSDTSRKPLRFMWCARLLKWKHPELVVLLAEKLKKDGVDFQIDVYGSEGRNIAHESVFPKRELCSMVEKLQVFDYVIFHDEKTNAEIIKAMCEHDIFLFTSDKTEGWGAVANEAMASGCCLVGSSATGAVPYLVEDGVNGSIFNDGDVDSLYEKVHSLINDPKARKRMAVQGCQDMMNIWSPRNAVQNFLELVDSLQDGRVSPIKKGPCSIA